MTKLPTARDCTFLKPNARIDAALPPELSLVRTGARLLAFTLGESSTTYALGIDHGGRLCGFTGTFSFETLASVVITKIPNGGFTISSADKMPMAPQCPPSGDFSNSYGISLAPQEQTASGPLRLVFASNGLSAGVVGDWVR